LEVRGEAKGEENEERGRGKERKEGEERERECTGERGRE
jgi:hypothetical protein